MFRRNNARLCRQGGFGIGHVFTFLATTPATGASPVVLGAGSSAAAGTLGLAEPAVVGPYTDLSCANRLADVLIGEVSALGNVV